jgi:hypothetical protein
MSSVSIYAQFVFFPDLAVQLVWIPVGAEWLQASHSVHSFTN